MALDEHDGDGGTPHRAALRRAHQIHRQFEMKSFS
jgi:hypothetical protein